MSTEATSESESYTLPNQEVDMFAKTWGEFKAYRAHIEASSKLRGVKDVIYDEEYLKQIVGDLLKHRPANVRIRIGSDQNGQTVETVVDSSLVAFQGLLRGSPTIYFSEGDINPSLLQFEIDTGFGLTDIPSSEATIGSILTHDATQEVRPLSVGIIDIRSDLPKIDVVARNVVDGIDKFDQHAAEMAYINGLDGQDGTEFVLRDENIDYKVGISKEMPGGERIPGLDVQIGMLLLQQLNLPPEEAGNLGELGPVYTRPVKVPAGDAF